ncbi:response regulator [Marinobacterium rhizophilum]|uniref:response regulator n=1 Tax=Marinobacterium rhizophilum TaxID=420402 RepID=UPI00035E44DB|nr:response regulator transcription factor [Marinobacterium rhizophilum]
MKQNRAGVVLVDDHPLFRRGVAELLNDSGRFQVLAEFDQAESVMEQLQVLQPDLLLLDLQMPGIGGLELLPQVKAFNDRIRVVLLTASDDSQHLLQALRAGADGYLLKETDADVILTRLDAVLEGKVALDDESLQRLTLGLREAPQDRPTGTEPQHCADLTLREHQTLALIARGLSNKLIARELGISDGTVKVYVKALLRKLNLHTRLELAAWVHNHPEFELELES